MTYIAKLVSVAKYKNITTKLKPFVEFQSTLEKLELDEDDEVAILQIEGTESYLAIFLSTKPTIDDIESKLASQETKLNNDAKKILEKYVNGN
jgi:hypothetical protein